MTLESALVTAIGALCGLVSWFGNYFYRRFEELRKKMRQCEALNTRLFVIIASATPDNLEDCKRLSEDLMKNAQSDNRNGRTTK